MILLRDGDCEGRASRCSAHAKSNSSCGCGTPSTCVDDQVRSLDQGVRWVNLLRGVTEIYGVGDGEEGRPILRRPMWEAVSTVAAVSGVVLLKRTGRACELRNDSERDIGSGKDGQPSDEGHW